MSLYKQFTDEENVSHNIPLSDETIQALTQWAPAKRWRLHVHPPGTFLDWHPASGGYLIIVLSGEIEIGTSDGNTLVCKPGTLRMTSDTGKGHTGRVLGDGPCTVLMVDLAE